MINTEYIKIDDKLPLDEQLLRPVDIIKKGGLVAFPTETVYGLGASALDEEASKKIYLAKGRPSDNPLIIHISKPSDAEKYCYTNESYYKIANKFMPGPITVILKKKDNIPLTITGGLDTVAVRCPENKVANKFIELCGFPIAAPSANTSGKPSPTKAEHVFDDMNGKIDCIIDGGQSTIGLESTIVRVIDNKCTLLRPGGITINQLYELFQDIEIDKAVISKLSDNEHPLAPGMKYRHYAPKAPVYLILRDNNDSKIIEFLDNKISTNIKTGILASNEIVNRYKGKYSLSLGANNNEREQAQNLFDRLREFDKLDVEEIYVVINQKNNDLGLAIYNRLLKASGFNIIEL